MKVKQTSVPKEWAL